jgi:hypothetical protein
VPVQPYFGWGKGVSCASRLKAAPALCGAVMICVACRLPVPARAQVPLIRSSGPGPVLIINSDQAVLEEQEVRKDLPCTVTPEKPVLGFDLRFHAGYDVSVPLSDLAGDGDLLTILFRVTPSAHPDEPSYFVQNVNVPHIDDDAHGAALLSGSFDLGEGDYHVDWLMRDRSERVCSFYWDADASLPSRDKQMQVALPPGTVRRAEFDQFNEEAPVVRAPIHPPLNIKLLVNFGPQNQDSPALRPVDTLALVTMLRRVASQPEFGKFSLVAFNMQEERVLYRQASANKIDFPSLGAAVHQIKLGTVNLTRLANKHSDTEFLAHLLKTELTGEDHPDAVIFAGPKIMLDQSVPDDELKSLASTVDYPVFYMNYNLDPQAVPWRDSISRAIKAFRGTEYTISRPRDLWFAVSEMVSRIVQLRHGRIRASISSQ